MARLNGGHLFKRRGVAIFDHNDPILQAIFHQGLHGACHGGGGFAGPHQVYIGIIIQVEGAGADGKNIPLPAAIARNGRCRGNGVQAGIKNRQCVVPDSLQIGGHGANFRCAGSI